MLGQTFELHDLLVIAFLVLLEGVLSIDNALVLGLLARQLPERLRPRALSYGLIGALVFRVLAIVAAGFLLRWRFPKLLGGLYLIYVAVKHFLTHQKDATEPAPDPRAAQETLDDDLEELGIRSKLFWKTVIAIELTDIAFAVDSIVAAIAMVSTTPTLPGHKMHPKLWLVMIGGMIGVVAMRFAAAMFIKLLDKFPRFETSAYLLVLIIGVKLLVDYFFNAPGNERFDFQHPSDPAFWGFWGAMIACFGIGFIPPKARQIV